jgi:F-type H+-transporting ATPase subunit b
MLNIDLITVLAEILNFAILAVGLYYLAFKPIVKKIDERAEEKKTLMEAAQQKNEEAEQKLEQVERRLKNIDIEIEARLEKAYEEAKSESEALLQSTQKEAQQILLNAKKEASKRMKQETEVLQDELVDTILRISGEVLRKTAPDDIHHKLVENLNAEIWDLGKRDMRQVSTIRDSLAERTPTVYVTTARELTPDQQRALVRTFSALADTNVSMEIQTDPQLIAGIRVRMGDLVVENSLNLELSELKSHVVQNLEESLDGEA